MEPTHRYVYPKVQNGHNIRKPRRSFFVWLDNLNKIRKKEGIKEKGSEEKAYLWKACSLESLP
jgi:hypothetical protein